MGAGQKFSAGIQLIATLYNSKLNEQPFNRRLLKDTVSTLTKMGFKHIENDGTLAVLKHDRFAITHTIRIGRQGDLSFFEHMTTEQTSFVF